VLALPARLRVKRGLSLLYLTHNLLCARLVTDELLALNQGRRARPDERTSRSTRRANTP
jgi:ABC-type glutathione transport system ATPase component